MRKKLYIAFVFLATFLVNINYVHAVKYDNYVEKNELRCGNLTFNASIADIVYYIILFIEIAVPITIVIFGMVDLIKAMTSGKEEENKKYTNVLFKRLVVGALVFLVVFIVKFAVSFVNNDQSVLECINCFANGSKACGK